MPQEGKESYPAMEALLTARNAILKGSGELLTNRARVEKFRESDQIKAREAYLELQRTRNRVVTALGDARRSLLEAEEYGMA